MTSRSVATASVVPENPENLQAFASVRVPVSGISVSARVSNTDNSTDFVVSFAGPDAHFNVLVQQTTQALVAAGLRPQDLLAGLRQTQTEVLTDLYGADYLRELEEERLALQNGQQAE